MIRRIVGWILALATLAIIVFAVMNCGNYRSMLVSDTATAGEQPVEQPES